MTQDEIILLVKREIANNSAASAITGCGYIDGNDVDNIAENVADEVLARDKTKEILQGFLHWINGAIEASFNYSVKGSVHHGGKNSAFHEVKAQIKKVAKAYGVEVEE